MAGPRHGGVAPAAIEEGQTVEITRADGCSMKFIVLDVNLDGGAITLSLIPEPPPEPPLVAIPTLDKQGRDAAMGHISGLARDPHARLPPGWHPVF